MADDKRPPEFMSALVTEHFVLQSAASSTISESGSRVAIHLSALSSGLAARSTSADGSRNATAAATSSRGASRSAVIAVAGLHLCWLLLVRCS